jgi:hypothetical protein
MATTIAIIDTYQITAVRDRVLAMGVEMNVDSTVMIAALADVVGIAMAVLNKNGQTYQRVGIDARLEVFTDRARETFARTAKDMVDHRVISNAVEQGLLRT